MNTGAVHEKILDSCVLTLLWHQIAGLCFIKASWMGSILTVAFLGVVVVVPGSMLPEGPPPAPAATPWEHSEGWRGCMQSKSLDWKWWFSASRMSSEDWGDHLLLPWLSEDLPRATLLLCFKKSRGRGRHLKQSCNGVILLPLLTWHPGKFAPNPSRYATASSQ